MDRITKNDLQDLEKQIAKKYGYLKYKVSHRYNYEGVDEFDEMGRCLRTYRTALTKRQAYFCLLDLLNG